MTTEGRIYQLLRTLVLLSNRDNPARRTLKPGGQVAQGHARRQVAQNYVTDCRSQYSVNNMTDAIALMANEAAMQGLYEEFLELLFLVFLSLHEAECASDAWYSDDDDFPDMSNNRSGTDNAAAAR